MTLEAKLAKIDQDLDFALSAARVKLVAVSKYAQDEQVIEAYNLGQRLFGENYVLPALRRQARLDLPGAQWHLLGPLQKNKVNKAVGAFEVIQSVHNLELVELIDQRARFLGIKQKIFLQINSTGDKNGFCFETVPEALRQIYEFENIELRGFMTMGPYEISKISETIYKRMRLLKEEMMQSFPLGVFELSMGMSNDYLLAVNCGSTMIRIGRKLFSGNEVNKGEV